MNYEKPDGNGKRLYRGFQNTLLFKESIIMCGFNFGNGNSCCWIIIILLIIWFCCCNNHNDNDCGCGCNNNNNNGCSIC